MLIEVRIDQPKLEQQIERVDPDLPTSFRPLIFKQTDAKPKNTGDNVMRCV